VIVRAPHRLQANSRPVGPQLLLVIATWFCLCAAVTPKVKTQSAWEEGVPHDQSFTKVLVIGVTPDFNQRCTFEHFMTARVASESVQAIASCDLMKPDEPLTRENVERAVAARQADAVLATTLVAADWAAREGGGRNTRGDAYYKATGTGWGTGYYGMYGVPVVYGEFQTAPTIMTLKGEVHIATKLYATKGPTLVYSLDTKAKDIGTRESGLTAIAAQVADRLRRDKLIR
jgi:hypothetical protein